MKSIIFYACVFLLIVALVTIEIFAFQYLWNWLVPLFWTAAPILNFWQSFGIIILLNIIGSFFKKNS